MATGGKTSKSKELNSDDTHIQAAANSHPGASRKQQNRHSGSYSEGQNSRQRQDRQAPHNMSKKQRHQQHHYQTPNNNERWDIPYSGHGSLARDLFGAEGGSPHQFNFQIDDPYSAGYQNFDHGYRNGPRNGPWHNNSYRQQNYGSGGKNNRQNRSFQSSAGQSSRHQNGHGGAQNTGTKQNGQPKANNNAKPNIPNSNQNYTESEREVKFFETLMKDGQKSENLTITVTSNDERKGKEKMAGKSSADSGSKKAATPDDKKSYTKQPTPASKFVNPLMSPEPADDTKVKGLLGAYPGDVSPQMQSESKVISKELVGDHPGKKSYLSDAIAPAPSAKPVVTPEGDEVEKPEKKKKKARQRERKKKREKDKKDNQNQSAMNDGRSSQMSNASSSESNAKPDTSGTSSPTKEVANSDTVQKSGNKKLENDQEKSSANLQKENGNEAKKPENKSASEQDAINKKLEEMGLQQAEKRLEKDMIYKLEKSSQNFPQAKYFCKLCSHHLDSIALAHKHIKDKRHKKETKAWQKDELLRQLKSPPPAALAVLDRQLASVVEKNMLSQDDVKEREEVVKRLNEVVKQGLTGCSVVAYGSSVTGIGLQTSDVNVDIKYNGDMKTPNVLLELLRILQESDDFIEVCKDFDAKVPLIEVTDKLTHIRCVLSTNNASVILTTRLLKIYCDIEPTMIQLASLLRLWGHLCEVDSQEDGSLPPRSFILMAIFYLQQKHGLPVLHEIMGEHDIDALISDDGFDKKILEQKSGEWWYNPTAPPTEKKEKKKDEETEEDADETADFSDCDLDDVEIFFEEESPKESTAPPTPDVTTGPNSLSPVKLAKCFDENGKPTLAVLWLGLLKFYSAQFDMENLIITIRTSKKVTRSDRGWSHRRIAVEDPCSPKWNLCKPMNSQTLFTYFLTRLKHSVFYFHTAHNSAKPMKNKKKIAEKDKKLVKQQLKIFGKTPDELSHIIIESAYEEVIPGHKSRLNNKDVIQDQKPGSDDKEVTQGQNDEEVTKAHKSRLDDSKSVKREADAKGQSSTRNSDVTKKISSLADDMVDNMLEDLKIMNLDENLEKDKKSEFNYTTCYKFTKAVLMDGKAPVVICNSCKKEGHRKKECPDEAKIEFHPLPPMTKHLRRMLDQVCREMYDMYVPMEDEERMRDKVCSDLLKFLQENYSPNTKMCLFGSSRNRFTFCGSDLDICMTFEGNETGEFLDFTNIIEDLAKTLRKNPDLRNIIPITTAKVPIVKFYHPKANLEGDISLYNLLAQRNTSMLALYASIDERCRLLGYAMKAFVKRCCIGDASRGSLSSYAYTLLVIYFLQQRDPPVLPVLQELYTGEKSPEHIVDGWNSWFYDSIGNLANVWPEFGKNKETLGELWIGMLIFYTEVFDFRRHVASIKQRKLLTAFEKEWTSKCICIEDPFDLSHNLGAGVSRKMTNFIMKVFIKARERFGTDPGNKLNGAREYKHYFFDAEVLMDGQEVPNDRCCRICGKIGHFVKDCPKRRTGRGKKNDETKIREVQCFSCGQKGHFKKDCPNPKQAYGSPRKDAQFHHQGQPLLLMPPPHMVGRQHMVIPPPLMMQRPVIVQAKRQDGVNMNFQDPRNGPARQNSHPGGRTPQKASEAPQKTPDSTQKKQNQERKSELSQKQTKTPQNRHKMQQSDEVTTPQNRPPSKSPHPSSGPISRQRSTPGKAATPKQVNRSLSSDFDNSKAADPKKSVKPFSTLTPESRRGLTLRDTNQKKPKTPAESPSPSSIPTVAEIESKMLEQVNETSKKKPKAGDSLNHLIPRQTSNEDSRRPINNNQQRYPGYPQSPPYHPFSPMSPPSPYMYPYPSTSPRNVGNPFHFGQHPGHGSANQQMARTPPSPGGYHGPPMGQNPHGPSMGQNPHGPPMGQNPHGPQMGQNPHGPQMVQNSRGPQMGQSPHGSQMGQNFHGPRMSQSPHGPQMAQSPRDRGHYFTGVSPPGAGYGHPQSGSRRGHNQGQRSLNSDHLSGHITGVTFINSNEQNIQHSQREVRFTPPSSAPPHPGANLHHSYPPNMSHPQYWGTPSPRK